MSRDAPTKYAAAFTVLRVGIALPLFVIFLAPWVWFASTMFSEQFRNGGVVGVITDNAHTLAILLFVYTGSVLIDRRKRTLKTLALVTLFWGVLAAVRIGTNHGFPWARIMMFAVVATSSVVVLARQRRPSAGLPPA
jgi:hypothetical protein